MDSTTLLHAITFLLAPLSSHYPAQVLDALHLALLSSFSSLDIATRPQTILLSPTAPPPPSIIYALQTLHEFPAQYRVQWADWMLLLGNGNQLMLTIVAGCVQLTIRDIHTGQVSNTNVWNAALQTRTPSPWGSSVRSRSSAPSSSDSSADSGSSRASSPVVIEDVAVEAAENVLNDSADERLFSHGYGRSISSISMIPKAKSLSAAAPEWFPAAVGCSARPTHSKTPSLGNSFASSGARLGPVGAKRAPYQTHSRSSSRSSTMSSAPSLISSHSSASSNAATLSASLASLSLRSKTPAAVSAHSTGGSVSVSSSSPSSSGMPPSPTPSEMSDSVDAAVYLDESKDQLAVTEYECGKVGVLTGAVMLGVPRGPKSVKIVGGAKVGGRRL